MQKFVRHKGVVLPLDYSNVDTDIIIPKQYLKSTKRTGFGPNLFDSWRYTDDGELGQDHSKRPKNPNFVMNDPKYQGASIALVRENFGCGSSREHAVWAFIDEGFCAVIAVSFAEIFYSNAIKNGLLPISLAVRCIDDIFDRTYAGPPYELDINLPEQVVRSSDGKTWTFSIDALSKRCLIGGLDSIAMTLLQREAIKAFEDQHKRRFPWLFSEDIRGE